MSNVSFFPGDKVELRSTFRTKPPTSALVDPGAVTVTVKRPNGTTESIATTRESLGVYFCQYSIKESGAHYYRFFGSTPADKSDEGSFTVLDSRVGVFVVTGTGTAAIASLAVDSTGATP